MCTYYAHLVTFLSVICDLDTFAEGHRHKPKGMKVNQKIIKKIEKVYLFFVYEEACGPG